STFLVSDLQGDVDATPQRVHGLFYRDTRFLSRWRLTLNGAPLELLSTDTETHYFSAQFFLVPSRAALGADRYVSVIRKRVVGEGVHEDIEVINHNLHAVELELRLDADADFADLFEVKDRAVKKGELYRRSDDGRLVLGYRRGSFVRETWIEVEQ